MSSFNKNVPFQYNVNDATSHRFANVTQLKPNYLLASDDLDLSNKVHFYGQFFRARQPVVTIVS